MSMSNIIWHPAQQTEMVQSSVVPAQLTEAAQMQIPATQAETEQWYGLQTRPRHEKMVAQRLEERGVTTFLPLVTEVRRWSDRKKSVQLPLFSCYVFARFIPKREDRLRVLRVEGVFGLVGARGEGASIPEEQIGAVRNLIEGKLPYAAHPFLKIGQRVRIRSGALDGLEGILVSRNGDRTLVISVDAIQRSLAVRVSPPVSNQRKKMTIKALVMSDRSDEYTGKKGLVKQQIITVMDLSETGERLAQPIEYAMSDEEK